MILPDINLLLYAHNESVPYHARARVWWEGLMMREVPIGVPWAVLLGFLRLTTHPAVLTEPLAPLDAFRRIEDWFDRDHVEILDPGPRHLSIVRRLLEATEVAGNLTTETHLAALAIEHQCELHSNDSDFQRFPGLRWHNPLT